MDAKGFKSYSFSLPVRNSARLFSLGRANSKAPVLPVALHLHLLKFLQVEMQFVVVPIEKRHA